MGKSRPTPPFAAIETRLGSRSCDTTVIPPLGGARPQGRAVAATSSEVFSSSGDERGSGSGWLSGDFAAEVSLGCCDTATDALPSSAAGWLLGNSRLANDDDGHVTTGFNRILGVPTASVVDVSFGIAALIVTVYAGCAGAAVLLAWRADGQQHP